MNRATRRLPRSAPVVQQARPAPGGFREALGELFPVAPEAAVRTRRARLLWVAGQVAAAGIATVALLLRVPGRPAWRTIFGEDYFKFLPWAIQHPWHLFAYSGYVELAPQFIAQVVRYLPLPDASVGFALAGAATTACCALFIFHASAGHVRSVTLRALLAVGLVLLPAALMEVIDSGVDTPWYLLPTLFWAVLWRPRTRSGMAVAAVVAFVAAASNILAVLVAPVLAVRLYVLRRPREHAASIGWLAGLLVQVPFVYWSTQNGHSRLSGHKHATPGQALGFYGHAVLLPSLGWHLSWWLRSHAGTSWATAIAAIVLAAIFAVILRAQPRARSFVVTALVAGFLFTVVSVAINRKPAIDPMSPALVLGTRYTIMADFLILSAVIVGVDHALRSRARGRLRQGTGLKPVVAVTALVVFLAATWGVDFRYTGLRSTTAWNWAPIAATWERDCAHSPTGEISVTIYRTPWTLPCRNITP